MAGENWTFKNVTTISHFTNRYYSIASFWHANWWWQGSVLKWYIYKKHATEWLMHCAGRERWNFNGPEHFAGSSFCVTWLVALLGDAKPHWQAHDREARSWPWQSPPDQSEERCNVTCDQRMNFRKFALINKHSCSIPLTASSLRLGFPGHLEQSTSLWHREAVSI